MSQPPAAIPAAPGEAVAPDPDAFGKPEPEPAPEACPAAAGGPTDAEVIELARTHARSTGSAPGAQPIYISLAHLAEGRDECDLNTLRYGMGKLVNMLSWADEIIAPEFIDGDATVARVDLAELGWSPEALGYVLGISDNITDGVLSPADPIVVRGDWLAAYATRPPAYVYIMRNEASERLIEAQMGVDFTKPGRLAGVSDSIVTLHPRILERRESEGGACWISHDFLHRTQALAVLETGVVPQDDLRFAMQQYIAREYICTLPNGMHSYHVTGFVSQRRWDGNTCVARNRAREDNLVLTGQCFNCHTDGLIDFEDEVRANKTNPSPHIMQHYPTQGELAALIQGDQEVFHAAIEQIPYHDAAVHGPVNALIGAYAQRTGDPLRESPAGAFGAILPGGATAGPFWEDVINPIATIAVDVGVLLPAEILYETLVEQVIPDIEARYREVGIDPHMNCE